MNITIKDMTLEDISNLEFSYAQDFDSFWSIDTLKKDFQNTYSHYLVAKQNNEIVGFAGFIQILEQADIMNIVVKTNKRRLGIGSLLLEKLVQKAQNLNCKLLTLEVNEHNLPAIHLYEKYEFERIGFRKKYYNNKDNAIIMSLSLNENVTKEENE